MATKQELEEKLVKSVEQNEKLVEKVKNCSIGLYNKINELRKNIRQKTFVYDKELPSNLGGGEYYSIDQFYNALQDECINVGLDFSFETIELIRFDVELVKISGSSPRHVATVKTIAKLTDINTGDTKEYVTIGQGSDTLDKAVSSASSIAFRNWFYKNFTPRNMEEEELDKIPTETSKPKVPVYVPEKKKEEIKEKVVEQKQISNDEEDIKEIVDNIMKIREKINDEKYGASTLEMLMSGVLEEADILEIDLKVKNKMEKVGL